MDQRALFEAAVVTRLKESGFLEIQIRVECLVRCDDGYQDEVVNAGWHYWNAALAAQAPISRGPADIDQKALTVADDIVRQMMEKGALLAIRNNEGTLVPVPLERQFQLKAGWQISIASALKLQQGYQPATFITGWDTDASYVPPEKIFVNGITYVPAHAESYGPTYLDFITPDEIFDKGPAAVKLWQAAKRAEINRTKIPDHTKSSGLHPSHATRASDASTFDEVCTTCGATDIAGGGWGKLADPCPSPSTGGATGDE
ncbi:hypothetical protein LJR098_002293 [Rhizobium sp. LjRoot98]|uniref:hypothetical protein n=1 Tax=Rhizobium sp. LjRoot98 TaxID=3342345 RepID=UPI003ECCD4D0